jgi:integrase
MKGKKFPLKIKRGNITVTVYKSRIGGKPRYRVCYYEHEIPKYVTFSDPVTAENHANDVADKLVKNEVNVLTFSRADHDEYITAVQHAKAAGMSLIRAASLMAQVKQILGGEDKILEAAHYYAQKFPATFPDKSVAEVKDEFIQYHEARKSSARYLSSLRHHLEVLAKSFQCPMRFVTYPELDQFLQNLNRKPKTINNFVGTIKTFFNFGKKRGYLPRDCDEADRLEKVREQGGIIEVWSPEELIRLFKSALVDISKSERGISNRARRVFIPSLAIGAFAGLRSQEIERLDWQDIKMNEGVILVRAYVGGERNKTGKRTAPLLPNLRAWLEPFAQQSGRVCPYSHPHYYDIQRSIAETTATASLPALQWRHNALRHSFISYRVQIVGNRYTVAEEAGNSPEMIKRHYLEMELPNGDLITKKQAVVWFSIFPTSNLEPLVKNDPQLLPKLIPAAAA